MADTTVGAPSLRDASAWHAANNGHGKRIWFIYREAEAVMARYAWGTGGNLRRFASYEAAQRAAEMMNAQ